VDSATHVYLYIYIANAHIGQWIFGLVSVQTDGEGFNHGLTRYIHMRI